MGSVQFTMHFPLFGKRQGSNANGTKLSRISGFLLLLLLVLFLSYKVRN